MDAHDAKVWALCVSDDESKMVSGSADGTFVQWKVWSCACKPLNAATMVDVVSFICFQDVTEQEVEEARNKQIEMIQK